MYQDMIFGLIGGLGFFFFGMKTMSDGLKKIAGEKLKSFLHAVTKHRIYGILIGAGITVLIQSSSATTVMVVGFVNAGLLGLKQAITVVMGANIGTTFTAWLVSSMSIFKITSYALPAVGIGYAIMNFTKRKRHQDWGEVLIGFGFLFIGLSFLKDGFSPLKDMPAVKDAFVFLSTNPFYGVFAGIIFTILLQSSSATIAIVQVLAFNGVISFEAAIPIILGDNIGTTITAQMAAIGTNLNARRTAMSHTLFNVIGVSYMLVLVHFGIFQKIIFTLIPTELTSETIMFFIAVAHSSFNVLNTIIFLPFVGLLERICTALVPKKGDSIDFGTQYLERHLLDTPSLALEQVYNENIYMLGVARKAATLAIDSFLTDNLDNLKKVEEYENITDNLQSEITEYIVMISRSDMRKDDSEQIPVLIHNVNDLERIGDHSQNIAEITRRKVKEDLPFTEEAIKEVKQLWHEVEIMFDEAQSALKNHDIEQAQELLKREGRINQLQVDFKRAHIERLNEGKCNMSSGFLFVELIDNLEKIADRLTNISESVIGQMRWILQKKKEKKV